MNQEKGGKTPLFIGWSMILQHLRTPALLEHKKIALPMASLVWIHVWYVPWIKIVIQLQTHYIHIHVHLVHHYLALDWH